MFLKGIQSKLQSLTINFESLLTYVGENSSDEEKEEKKENKRRSP